MASMEQLRDFAIQMCEDGYGKYEAAVCSRGYPQGHRFLTLHIPVRGEDDLFDFQTNRVYFPARLKER